jgi:cAMP-dependent protein kinase regulator
MAPMTSSGHDLVREWLWKGQHARAAWAAAMMLEKDAADLHALGLCGWSLLELQRKEEGTAALRECAESALEAGDLPLGLACFFVLRGAGADVAGLLDTMAADYHRDAPRVKRDQRLLPPLPRELGDVPGTVDRGEAARRAAAAAKAAREQLALNRSMVFERPALPAVPLLGALSTENLRAVLEASTDVRVGPDELLVEQGAEGDAVFLVVCGWARVVHRERTGEEVTLRRLAPGSVVGEVALVTRAPRVASIRSDTGLMVLRLSRDTLEELSAKEPGLADELVAFCQQKMIANLLDASPLFNRLGEGEREAALRAFDRRVVGAGEVLIRQGEPSPGLFLVVAGQAEVLRTDEKTGQVVRLAQLGPAEAFGEMSLLLKRPATATVQMVYDSAVLMLPRERFLKVVGAHPEVLAELYRLAEAREEETRSLLGRPSESADDMTLM